MARVFVTGASGVIGRALVKRLRERGVELVGLARSETAARALDEEGIKPARGDVLNEEALAAGMGRCEIVYHVAGVNSLCPTNRAELFRVNVTGAERVVRAAARAGVRRVVNTSSASSIGEAHGTVGKEDSPHRGWFLSSYERSKLEGERAAFAAGRELGIEVVAVNPASVQGPGRASGTGKIVLALVDGRLRAFVDTRFSLVDIDDCVEGHLLAQERGRPGERYLLCGTTLSSAEAIELVREIAGTVVRPRMLPPAAAEGLAAVVEAAFRVARRTPPVCREMVRTMLHGHAYDGSKATRELGLRYTPARETLRRTIEWAVEQGLVERPRPLGRD
jgi:dihydroflavonol-4-reductase